MRARPRIVGLVAVGSASCGRCQGMTGQDRAARVTTPVRLAYAMRGAQVASPLQDPPGCGYKVGDAPDGVAFDNQPLTVQVHASRILNRTSARTVVVLAPP